MLFVLFSAAFFLYIVLWRIRSEWILRLECVCLYVGACSRREPVLCEVIVESFVSSLFTMFLIMFFVVLIIAGTL